MAQTLDELINGLIVQTQPNMVDQSPEMSKIIEDQILSERLSDLKNNLRRSGQSEVDLLKNPFLSPEELQDRLAKVRAKRAFYRNALTAFQQQNQAPAVVNYPVLAQQPIR